MKTNCVYFPTEKRAEGIVFEGDTHYNLRDTPGTLQFWLRRGCTQGDPKKAKDDPRFINEKKEEKEVKPAKPRGRKPQKEVEEKPEKVENKEEQK